MAKVLDIAVETVEGSLSAIYKFLFHNAFSENPYAVQVRIITHVVFCATVSYLIWQFTRSTDSIDIIGHETALYLLLLTVNWLVSSFIYFMALRTLRCSASFKDVFTVYTFVHSNVLLISSLAALIVFVFLNDFAVSKFELEVVRQLQHSSPFNVLTTTTTYLQGAQIVFLSLAVILILLYEPAHLALVTDARRPILYLITILITASSLVIQIRQWNLVSTSSQILDRVLEAPDMFIM